MVCPNFFFFFSALFTLLITNRWWSHRYPSVSSHSYSSSSSSSRRRPRWYSRTATMASRPSATCATSTITTRCVCCSLCFNQSSFFWEIEWRLLGPFFFPKYICNWRASSLISLTHIHVTKTPQHVSTPTYMPSDVNVCREYQHEACCSLETVRKWVFFFFTFFFPNFFSREGRERDKTRNPLSLF